MSIFDINGRIKKIGPFDFSKILHVAVFSNDLTLPHLKFGKLGPLPRENRPKPFFDKQSVAENRIRRGKSKKNYQTEIVENQK